MSELILEKWIERPDVNPLTNRKIVIGGKSYSDLVKKFKIDPLKVSPKKSPKKSSKGSPKKSPKKSSKGSPKKSPKKSSKGSPKKSPKRSPKKSLPTKTDCIEWEKHKNVNPKTNRKIKTSGKIYNIYKEKCNTPTRKTSSVKTIIYPKIQSPPKTSSVKTIIYPKIQSPPKSSSCSKTRNRFFKIDNFEDYYWTDDEWKYIGSNSVSGPIPRLDLVNTVHVVTGYEGRLEDIANGKHIRLDLDDNEFLEQQNLVYDLIASWTPEKLGTYNVPHDVENLGEIVDRLIDIGYCKVYGLTSLKLKNKGETLVIQLIVESG